MSKHPEQRADEVFLGNSYEPLNSNLLTEEANAAFDLENMYSPYAQESRRLRQKSLYGCCTWKSKRLGQKAYDSDGKVVVGCRPLFASREEVAKNVSSETMASIVN